MAAWPGIGPLVGMEHTQQSLHTGQFTGGGKDHRHGPPRLAETRKSRGTRAEKQHRAPEPTALPIPPFLIGAMEAQSSPLGNQDLHAWPSLSRLADENPCRSPVQAGRENFRHGRSAFVSLRSTRQGSLGRWCLLSQHGRVSLTRPLAPACTTTPAAGDECN